MGRSGADVLMPTFLRRCFGAETFWHLSSGAGMFWCWFFGAEIVWCRRFVADTVWSQYSLALIRCDAKGFWRQSSVLLLGSLLCCEWSWSTLCMTLNVRFSSLLQYESHKMTAGYYGHFSYYMRTIALQFYVLSQMIFVNYGTSLSWPEKNRQN